MILSGLSLFLFSYAEILFNLEMRMEAEKEEY